MSKETKKLVFRYSLVFAISFIMIFSFFLTYGKSFVWKKDGLYQHFNAFVYFGQYVRELLKNLFLHNTFKVKMWEPGFGYGADIYTTLCYYSFGDPFAFIAVFFKSSACEIGYALAIILRFYCAGLAFMAYCINRGKKGVGVICAAIVYIFCSFALFAGVRHPYFINPMIYLPLLFLGVDKIKRNESPVVYVLAVFVSALSNFYFFYMLVLLTVIYVVIRTLCDRKERKAKVLFKRFCLYAGFGFLGVMMAAILFLPNAMNFLNNERITGVYRFAPLYTVKEYAKLFVSLMGTGCGPFWSYIGLSPVAYLGTVCFLYNKKGGRGLWQKLFLAFLVICLVFPTAGYVFNGFGYVCNRWVFAWAFIISFLFVEGFDSLMDVKPGHLKAMKIFAGVYILLAIPFSGFTSPEVYIQSGVLVLVIILLSFQGRLKEIKLGKRLISPESFKKYAALIIVIMSVFSMGIYRYSGYARGYLETFRDIGTAYDLLTGERAKTFELIQDDGHFRIDNNTYKNFQANYMPSMKFSTTSVYFSLINPYISQFSRENSIYYEAAYEQRGLNNRSLLMPLAAVKYYVTDKIDVLLPHGFENHGYKIDNNAKYYIYQNPNALGMVYGFDKIYDEEKYKKAPAYKKQQILIGSAVINDDAELPGNSLEKYSPKFEEQLLTFDLLAADGLEYHHGKIIVNKQGAKAKFSIPRTVNNEIYVYFSGLKYESEEATASAVTASMGRAKDMYYVFTDKDIYAETRSEYMHNLGSMNSSTSEITLEFSEPGEYSYEKLLFVAMPLDSLDDQVEELRVDYSNIYTGINTFKVDVTLDKEKIVCLSIPYSKGFKAFVDGREVDLYRINTMYMGVLCSPGNHTIQLWYRTPYLMQGIILTFVGIGIFIGFVIGLYVYKKRTN